MGTGDRPVFPLINQRLDKKDLNLISTSIQDTITRTLGQIFAGSGGLLSTLVPTLTYPTGTTVNVAFAPFRAAWSAPNETYPQIFDGGVMVYDPARPLQATNSWALETFKDTAVVFWAKRYASQGVVDNRAYYSSGRKYAATNTLESEWVEIVPRAAAASAPDATFGWVRIAYIRADGWSGYTPTIRPIYFPDSLHFDIANYTFGNSWSSYADGFVLTYGSNHDGVGLGTQLRWIFNALARIIDSTWDYENDGRVLTAGSYAWHSSPPAGLAQLHTITESIGDRVTELEATTGILTLFSANVTWNAGAGEFEMTQSRVAAAGLTVTISTEAWNASNVARITFTGMPTTWSVTGIQVTRQHGTYPLTSAGSGDVPAVSVYAPSAPLPYTGLGGVTTFVIDVGHQYASSESGGTITWLEAEMNFSITVHGLKN